MVLIGDTLAASRRAHAVSQQLVNLMDCKGVPYLFIDTNTLQAAGQEFGAAAANVVAVAPAAFAAAVAVAAAAGLLSCCLPAL